ncbi:hypothetical protein TNCV_3512131 [Trichonephila clavipes]|nr:hypothetical protein TNCV_3512131 [Trichonephila clavipes]
MPQKDGSDLNCRLNPQVSILFRIRKPENKQRLASCNWFSMGKRLPAVFSRIRSVATKGRKINSEEKNAVYINDEAHFWLNGYVNKQNCRIWSEANPQVYVETPLHPEKLTVWCALWAG